MKTKRWLIGGAVVALLAFCAWGRAHSTLYYISSGAMTPTIRQNDYIWANPGAYNHSDPERGDIALIELKTSFCSPWSTGDPNEIVTFPKRIIGVPGDKVEMVDGRLKLNGVWQKEPFTQWGNGPRYSFKVVDGVVYSRDSSEQEWAREFVAASDQAKISNSPTEPIPAKKYLVLGDNRGNSNDSHVFGLVNRDTIQSRVALRLTPNPRKF